MYLEVYENFYNIPISGTYGLKIRLKNFDLLFALVLLFNYTALSQSESSTFFMYVISIGNTTVREELMNNTTRI